MKKILNYIKWLFNYISSIIMYSIIVILLLVGVLLAAYYIDYKKAARDLRVPLYGAYVIVSGSMEPIIKIRDAVLIKRVPEEEIKIGDVVTYQSRDESFYGILITHRVVGIKEEAGEKVYVTKGDHNQTIDRLPVKADQLYGKVIMRIPKIGYIKYFLVTSYGWIIAIVIPSLAIIIYDIIKLFKKINKNSHEMKVVNYEN